MCCAACGGSWTATRAAAGRGLQAAVRGPAGSTPGAGVRSKSEAALDLAAYNWACSCCYCLACNKQISYWKSPVLAPVCPMHHSHVAPTFWKHLSRKSCSCALLPSGSTGWSSCTILNSALMGCRS
jgi:hypothetical protein